MSLSNVDLPTPFGPTTATLSPRSTVKETSCSTRRPLKDFARPSTRSGSRPEGRPCRNWKPGVRRDERLISGGSIFSTCFLRAEACRALVAFARKRSMNCCISSMRASVRSISASFCSTASAFARSKAS